MCIGKWKLISGVKGYIFDKIRVPKKWTFFAKLFRLSQKVDIFCQKYGI